MEIRAASHGADAGYRRDIDGLRAIAVLSVVAFHAFPRSLPGGFVGVDIFFVISGFLISGIIFKGIDAGRFSLVDFYGRRVRRIFPALSLVLIACLILGSWLLFPAALAQLGLHVSAGAAFLSNILLWTESGYFDGDAATKPLLHLWSLGVEEQYYLVWPLILIVIGKRRDLRLAGLLAILVGSFALNIVIVRTHPVSDFYLPFTRFWELLVGALLTLAITRTRDWPLFSADTPRLKLIRNLLSWSGMLAFATSIACLRATQPFPGVLALGPVLGAVSLIAAGEGAWINRQILSAKIPVFVGLISYPLYLWHWPILVFQSLSADAFPSRVERIVAVGIAIGLAWLTYRFVELPVRTSQRPSIAAKGLVTVVALAGISGLAVYLSHGLPSRYPDALRAVALTDQTFDTSVYREGTCFLQLDQSSRDFVSSCVDAAGSDEKPVLLLWGDSHAASLYPGLRRVLGVNGAFRLAQFTASACPPIAGFSVASRPHCRAINDYVLDYIKSKKPNTVIMLASWTFYTGGTFDRLNLDEIERTASIVRELGVLNIIVVGPLPRWVEHQPTVVLREWNRTHRVVDRSLLKLDPAVFDFDHRIRAVIAPSVAAYFSPIDEFCNSQGCKVLVSSGGENSPMAWDDAHLTAAGSVEVARTIASSMLRGRELPH